MSAAAKPDSHTYCEFLALDTRWLSDWAEPLNTLTNIGFILVGIWVLLRWLQQPRQGDVAWLGLFLTCIGLGSWYFHMTQEGVMYDVIPIVVFLCSFLAVWVWRFTDWKIGAKWVACAAAVILFLAASIGATILASLLLDNSLLVASSSYVPTFFFVAFMGWHSLEEGYKRPGFLIAVAPLFALSLTMRSLDGPLCGWTHGHGLHTFWHLFNALCFYCTMRFLFANIRED